MREGWWYIQTKLDLHTLHRLSFTFLAPVFGVIQTKCTLICTLALISASALSLRTLSPPMIVGFVRGYGEKTLEAILSHQASSAHYNSLFS